MKFDKIFGKKMSKQDTQNIKTVGEKLVSTEECAQVIGETDVVTKHLAEEAAADHYRDQEEQHDLMRKIEDENRKDNER